MIPSVRLSKSLGTAGRRTDVGLEAGELEALLGALALLAVALFHGLVRIVWPKSE